MERLELVHIRHLRSPGGMEAREGKVKADVVVAWVTPTATAPHHTLHSHVIHTSPPPSKAENEGWGRRENGRKDVYLYMYKCKYTSGQYMG